MKFEKVNYAEGGASVPVAGWIVGAAYFIANTIVEAKTGHSITENLFDSGKY